MVLAPIFMASVSYILTGFTSLRYFKLFSKIPNYLNPVNVKSLSTGFISMFLSYSFSISFISNKDSSRLMISYISMRKLVNY